MLRVDRPRFDILAVYRTFRSRFRYARPPVAMGTRNEIRSNIVRVYVQGIYCIFFTHENNTRTTKVLFRARVDYPRTQNRDGYLIIPRRAHEEVREGGGVRIIIVYPYGAAADERFPMRMSAVRSGHVTAPASADRPARNPPRPPQPLSSSQCTTIVPSCVRCVRIVGRASCARFSRTARRNKRISSFLSPPNPLPSITRRPRPSLRHKSRKRLSHKILHRRKNKKRKRKKVITIITGD